MCCPAPVSVRSDTLGLDRGKASSTERYAPRMTLMLVFMRTLSKLKSTLSTDQWPSVLFKGALASGPTYLLWSMAPNSMLGEVSEP